MSPSTCPNFGFVVGFQLKSDSIRERGVQIQRGANNLRLFCQDPEIQLTYLPNVNGSWGEWTEAQNCPADHAACGIQTQINNARRMGRFSPGNRAVKIGNFGNTTFLFLYKLISKVKNKSFGFKKLINCHWTGHGTNFYHYPEKHCLPT
jgi:hypothetical protein